MQGNPREADHAHRLAEALGRSRDRVRKSISITRRHRIGDPISTNAWVRSLRADRDLMTRLGREEPTTIAGAVAMLAEVSNRLNRHHDEEPARSHIHGSVELGDILDRAIAGLQAIDGGSSQALPSRDLSNRGRS